MTCHRSLQLGLFGIGFLLSTFAPCANTNPHEVTSLTCDKSTIRTIDLPSQDEVELKVVVEQATWLEIEESGAEIKIGDTAVEAFRIAVPPRYERFFITVPSAESISVGRSQRSNTVASIRATLHCNPSPEERGRIEWYAQAGAVSAEVRLAQPLLANNELLIKLDELAEIAPDNSSQALILHLRAQALFGANRAFDATKAFAKAEAAWLAADDSSRALAARVGLVEELNRAGKYREAIEKAVSGPRAGATDAYFANRLLSSRCVGQDYLGDKSAAVQCYMQCIATLNALGERAEIANLELNLAYALRSTGHRDTAERYARHADDLAEGPDASMLRGRSNLLLSDLKVDRGDIAGALDHLDSAITHFEIAHAVRWQANTMLQAASLYTQLGALDEAHSFIGFALTRLSKNDAPARVAAALVTSARADIRAERYESALRSAQAAETIYGQLEMPAELDICRSVIATVYLHMGDAFSAREIVARADSRFHHGSNARQWDLIGAKAAITLGDLRAASTTLERLHHSDLTLQQQIDVAELIAQVLARSGNPARARAVLLEAGQHFSRMAQTVTNPLLQDLLLRDIAPLRSLAMELLLDEAEGAMTPSTHQRNQDSITADAWLWLQLISVPRSPSGTKDETNDNVNRFDAAVARELLSHPDHSTGDEESAATRRLLPILSNRRLGIRLPLPPLLSVENLQQSLEPDAVYVAYFDANTRGAMLWVTRNSARIVPAPSARVLREKIEPLLQLVASPESSVTSIYEIADVVSKLLLASAPSRAQPAILLVQSDALLSAIPWSVLHWQGSADELIDRTTITIVRPLGSCCNDLPQLHSHVQVLIAPQNSATEAMQLSTLPAAATEAQLIVAALGGGRSEVSVRVADSPAAVTGALSVVGDWVHIAAHGKTRDGRIGFTGIWLEPLHVGEAPSFLSGIDILGLAVRSDLVVLDACQLANRAAASVRPSMSFADSVLRAGAHNVIAAIWPTSDSAAAIWVPQFYRNVRLLSPSAFAEALRTAQLALRESRSFHHPFFWASLVHMSTLDIRFAQ